MSQQSGLPLWSAAVLTGSALSMLVGCGGISSPIPGVAPAQKLNLSGSVHGGQQPISGSQVYLYSVGAANGAVSTSMLTGAGYVTTAADGTFSITGDYTCPASVTTDNPNPDAISTYLLAEGGNPGIAGVTSNTAISLMSALGPCSGLSSTQFIEINEVSTVAAVTALQQFMTDGTHIGSATLSTEPGYSAIPNITNAMTTVNNLVSLSTGQALATPANGNGVSPQATVDTLGNVLAACVNSASPQSAGCTALFQATTPSGGTAPSDTLGAMLQIAQNPGTNVASLFSQAGTVVPFQPALNTAPNDFSLAISYTGANLTNPGPLVVDNSGNVWIANCASCAGNGAGADAIVGFTPSGAINSNTAGFVTNVYAPVALAIDRYNGLWVAESSLANGNQLTRLNTPAGTVEYPSSGGSTGFPVLLTGAPGGIALVQDAPADAFVTDSTNGQMSEYKYDGTLLGTVSTTGLANPTSIVLDGLQNLYLIGSGSSNLLQYSSGSTFTSPSTPPSGTFTTYSGAGLSSPVGLAADGGDHLWTIDQGTSKGVSELFGYTGAATSGSSGYSAGIHQASGIAIDGAGTAWIANCRANCGGTGPDQIVHLSTAGASLLPSDGLQSTTLAQPTAIAIDVSGNVWTSNASGSSVTELVGVATPVVTELESASSLNALGAVNYLQNSSFEAGQAVNEDSGANAIPGWTYSSSTQTSSVAKVDDAATNGGNNPGYAGNQRLTYYTGTNPFQASESQTVSVPNGTYLLSCYITGNSAVDVSLTATTNGVSTTNTPTNLTYNFQPFSVPNIVVSNGSLTVSLNAGGNTGFNYVAWDACSVTQQ